MSVSLGMSIILEGRDEVTLKSKIFEGVTVLDDASEGEHLIRLKGLDLDLQKVFELVFEGKSIERFALNTQFFEVGSIDNGQSFEFVKFAEMQRSKIGLVNVSEDKGFVLVILQGVQLVVGWLEDMYDWIFLVFEEAEASTFDCFQALGK